MRRASEGRAGLRGGRRARRKRRRIGYGIGIGIGAVVAALAAGCGNGDGSGGAARGAVTYYKDVLPILDRHCVACHSADGFAPFPLTSYDETHGYATLMAGATASRLMPPWPPAAGCGDFRDARTLTPAEIATLGAWDAAGAPAGNPDDGRAFAPVRPASLGAPGVTLDPGVAYQPNPAVTDDYHCFLVDPRLADMTDLVGFDIHPGAPASVHHVLLFAVWPDKIAAAQAKDAAEPGVGWTCFAGTGVDNTPTIGGWVPGSGAAAFPSSTGIRLAPGTQVVMQVHYNLLVQKQVSDRTTADLYFSPTPVAKPATVAAVLNNTFQVPAGAKSATVTADLPVKGSWALWGVVPHMHLHGIEIKVDIQHADGTSTCAVDVPRWSFHWQQFYYYKRPLSVVGGDTVHLACTYDNSPESQPVVGGAALPPAVLTWGEKSTDEMCLNFLYVTAP